jgi:hypothetical protein
MDCKCITRCCGNCNIPVANSLENMAPKLREQVQKLEKTTKEQALLIEVYEELRQAWKKLDKLKK